MTRREFLRGSLAAIGIFALPVMVAVDGSSPVRVPERPQAFRLGHGPDVAVRVARSANPNLLDLTVLRGGEVVERHTGVAPARMHRLGSRHFTVRYTAPPTAA